MTRHQYRHARTLDALELRGGQYIRARDIREGDTILRINPFHDLLVKDVEGVRQGVRVHADGLSSVLDDDEFVCVLRGVCRE